MLRRCSIFLIAALASAQSPSATAERQRRLDSVTRTRGFVALWDFVLREDGIRGSGRFAAHQRRGMRADLRLEISNYVRDYWGEGPEATYADLPLLGRGPFGQAVRFLKREGKEFRPMLYVPRERFHDSPLDVKGPRRSVSMVAWIVREASNHSIAGIWHEGTDILALSPDVKRVERGRRQYCLFAGLGANPGASAAHVSENGAASFGDRYARNLAVTPELIPTVAPDASPETIDAHWSVVGFSFDNARNTVTSYLNGRATENWIENPESHPFYRWVARAWLQGHLHREPGVQPGEDPSYPRDQFFTPPETKPLRRKILEEHGDEVTELREFEFTKVRVTYPRGQPRRILRRQLAALRVNPLWFPHDLYSPPSAAEGGPFSIGEVVHLSRGQGFIGYVGGVAVFDRALSRNEMQRLAEVARSGPIAFDALR